MVLATQAAAPGRLDADGGHCWVLTIVGKSPEGLSQAPLDTQLATARWAKEGTQARADGLHECQHDPG